MNVGYFYMFLALACFGSLGALNKISDVKQCRPTAVIPLVYISATMFLGAPLVLLGQNVHKFPSSIVWIALPFGACAAIGGLAFLAGLKYGKITTSWLVINLSAIVPTMGSILLYRERLNLTKTIALVLILVAVVLLWVDKRAEAFKTEK
jgi:drug/metabolite transporter (DMT)-like permease